MSTFFDGGARRARRRQSVSTRRIGVTSAGHASLWRIRLIVSWMGLGLALLLGGLNGCTARAPGSSEPPGLSAEAAVVTTLPYDASNPVICDNDSVLESYTDE